MRRIFVIGLSGSGKTFTAQRLSHLTNIELFQVDTLIRLVLDNQTRQQVMAVLEDIQQRHEWIIDGIVYHEARKLLSKADTVIFLKRSLSKRMFRVAQRWSTPNTPAFQGGNFSALLRHLWQMVRVNSQANSKHLQLFATLPEHIDRVLLRSDSEVETWLSKFGELNPIRREVRPNPIAN